MTTTTSSRTRPYHGGGPARIAPFLGLSTLLVLALGLATAWSILTAPLTVASLLDEAPATATTTASVVTSPVTAATPAPAADRASPGVAPPPGPPSTSQRPPTPVPARQPSPELSKTEVVQRVELPPGVRVTDKQVQEVARAVCQAFTDGYSWEQVAAALKKAGDRYNVSVSQDDATWAMRESVSSTCPHHQDELP